MNSFITLLPALVFVPLLLAISVTVITKSLPQRVISVCGALINAGFATALCYGLSQSGNISSEALRYPLGGWGAPLGIELSINGLAMLLLMLTAVLTLILTLYSLCYFTKQKTEQKFWPLWWLLIAGINALLLSADIFNLYVTLEIIGLAAVALVALGNTADAVSAALRYLLVGLTGSLCYLLAVALLYHQYGTLDFTYLASHAESNAITQLSLLLITIGLILKTALVPLHFWLPLAHSSAPAPVSAILSAIVVKASFYLLVTFWLDILSVAVTQAALMLMGGFGAVAIVYGICQAYRAQRLKIMVAYSTVAQIGYLFLLFPILQPLSSAEVSIELQREQALIAVAYFIVAHACAKAAMFMAAGNIIKAVGHDDIARLKGMARVMPASLFIFAIAGVSLIGLPPSAGFIAKWLLLNAAIDAHQWWWVVIILIGGLIAALAIFKVLDLAFIQGDAARQPQTVNKVPVLMPIMGLVLAGLTVALGFNAELLIDLVKFGGSS